MSKNKLIQVDDAPAAIGPYSQGVAGSNMVFTSGQLPIDPATKSMVSGDIKKSALTCLKNVEAVLTGGGAKLTDVVKVTVFVCDLGNFAAINEVYTEFFDGHKPARTFIEVSKLPLEADVEIEAIAVRSNCECK